MKRKCKKCGAALYQAEDLKWFCLLCLAREIEERDRENDVSGTWRTLDPKMALVEMGKHRRLIKRCSGKARPGDFSHS